MAASRDETRPIRCRAPRQEHPLPGRVAVFAPSPVLTVTLEDHDDDVADVHVHAGGQGLWQARMLRTLGAEVTVVAAFLGETGRVVRHLLDDEGIPVLGVEVAGHGAAYVHDRRSGERRSIAESAGDELTRHDVDELYTMALRAALAADATILSGTVVDETLPSDVYRRLAADLRTLGRTVVADLSGERLEAVLEGGVTLLKVSDEELERDGLTGADPDEDEVVRALHDLHARGADTVVVTRSHAPTLLLTDDRVLRVTVPQMQVVDTRGAGDSLAAAMTAVLARGGSVEEAVVTGTAAGALNVTRHGLGSGDAEAIAALEDRVALEEV